jgi:hypothetical protein
MKRKLWITLITCLAYCPDRESWKAIEYLKEQVRVLKEELVFSTWPKAMTRKPRVASNRA